MNPNATTIDRLMHYVEQEQYEQAEALAKLCDYLEECYLGMLPSRNDEKLL